MSTSAASGRDEFGRARPPWLAIAAIVLLALSLRLPGLAFGLDLADPARSLLAPCPDEETQALMVRDRHLTGEFRPGAFWQWGCGAFHLFGFADRALLPAIGVALGRDVTSPAALESDYGPLLLAHRILAVLAMMLALLWLAVIAAREFGRDVAWIAVSLLGVSYLAVRESHFGKLDCWLLLLTVALLDVALRTRRAPSLRLAVIGGGLVGVAAAFKYSGALLAAIFVVGQLAASFPNPGANMLRATMLRCLAGAGASIAAFLVLSPAVFVDFGGMLEGIRTQKGLIGFELEALGSVARFHAATSIGIGFGETATLLGILGVALALRRGGSSGRLLVAMLVASFALPLANTSHSARQALVVLAPLALLAALPIALLLRRSVPFGIALLVVALLPSFARSFAFDSLMARDDTRCDALGMLRDLDASPTDAIGIGFYGLPRRSAIAERSRFMDLLVQLNLRRSLTRDEAVRLEPRLVVRDRSAGVGDHFGDDLFAPLVNRDYRIVLEREGRRDGRTPELPEMATGNPALQVPFDAPWQMLRPGPALLVHQRIPR
jgi:hypothetical protein